MIILLFTCCCHLHTGVSVLAASGPMMTCDNNSCRHTLQGQLCDRERVFALIQTHKFKSILSTLWWGFTQDWDVSLTTGSKDCTGSIVVGTATVKRLRLYRHCSFALGNIRSWMRYTSFICHMCHTGQYAEMSCWCLMNNNSCKMWKPWLVGFWIVFVHFSWFALFFCIQGKFINMEIGMLVCVCWQETS